MLKCFSGIMSPYTVSTVMLILMCKQIRLLCLITRLTFNCLKSTVETVEKCVKSVQSQQSKHPNDVNDVVLLFLLLTLSIFHTSFCVSFVDVEQVNVIRVKVFILTVIFYSMNWLFCCASRKTGL